MPRAYRLRYKRLLTQLDAQDVPIPLHANELALLSSLLDEAMDLEGGRQAEWLDQLPAEHRRWRGTLERMLAQQLGPEWEVFMATLPKVDDLVVSRDEPSA